MSVVRTIGGVEQAALIDLSWDLLRSPLIATVVDLAP